MESTIELIYDELARLGVHVDDLKACNPTKLQLVDLLVGLQKAYAGRHDA